LFEQCSIAFDSTDKTRKVFGAALRKTVKSFGPIRARASPYRYPNAAPHVIARMERELGVIEKMGFISYFLINQDIVRFASSQGFFHVGRGSGANSLVAYCLGITDVDPIELDLYFERFISSARKKPPDFDIDFSWKDRDAVYRYVFDKYNGDGWPRQHSRAQLATYTTYQWRGAVRETGQGHGAAPRKRSMRSATAVAATAAEAPAPRCATGGGPRGASRGALRAQHPSACRTSSASTRAASSVSELPLTALQCAAPPAERLSRGAVQHAGGRRPRPAQIRHAQPARAGAYPGCGGDGGWAKRECRI
jgi:hypothetical protein